MNPLSVELALLLQAEGVGIYGTDIFVGTMPLGITGGIVLMDEPSDAPSAYLDTLYQSVTVEARYSETLDCYDKLGAVFSLLHRRANYDVGLYHVYVTEATGGYEDNDRDAAGYKLIQQTYRSIYRLTTTVS